MKDKHIKKIIKSEIENHIPERLDTSGFGLTKSVTASKKSGLSMQFKYGFSLATFVIIFIVAAMFLFEPANDPTLVQPYTFKADNEVVSFSAMSTTSLLSYTESQNLLTEVSKLSMTQSEADSVVDYVEPYLKLSERFLSQDNGFLIREVTSDLLEYTNKTEFETLDALGESIKYTMYYNIVNQDIKDDEETYEMEGLLIYGNKTYQFSGSKEIEEDEEVFEFTAYIDAANYVSSKHKVEEEETKFEFKTVINSILVEESMIEIEIEDDEKEIVLEFIKGNDYGTYKFKYETEDDITKLSIEFDVRINGIEKDGEIEVYVIVDEVTLETIYKLIVDTDEDEVYEYRRDRDEDEDDEDEDDEDDEDEEDSEEDEEDSEDDEEDDMLSDSVNI